MIQPGDVLSNSQVSETFGVGDRGGMRSSLKNSCLIIISDPTKPLFDDRWEGEILHYTGEGKLGDQTLTRQNRALAESQSSGMDLHLFEVLTKAEYVYAGQVDLCDAPYRDVQFDDEGKPRSVYMFPLRLKEGGIVPELSMEQIQAHREIRQQILSSETVDALRKRAQQAKNRPQTRATISIQIVRDEAVSEYVKRAANGMCDLCGNPAPFKNHKGAPYLECHHLTPLAKGGDDLMYNAVALCPNCHRKMHSINNASDKKSLLERIARRDEAKS